MIIAKRESLPRRFPSHLSRTLIALSPRPEWNINSPIRMKKGTGSRVKVVMDVKAPVATPTRPGTPPRKI
jgi:hypothetical protein